MSAMRVGRRTFLAAAAGAAAAAVPTRARAVDAGQAKARPVRLGGPIFEKSDDPELLARAHRARATGPRTARSSPWPTGQDQGDGASLRAERRGDRGGGPLGEPARRRPGQAPAGTSRPSRTGSRSPTPSARAAASTSPAPSARRAGSAPTPTTSRRGSSTRRSRTRGPDPRRGQAQADDLLATR